MIWSQYSPLGATPPTKPFGAGPKPFVLETAEGDEQDRKYLSSAERMDLYHNLREQIGGFKIPPVPAPRIPGVDPSKGIDEAVHPLLAAVWRCTCGHAALAAYNRCLQCGKQKPLVLTLDEDAGIRPMILHNRTRDPTLMKRCCDHYQ